MSRSKWEQFIRRCLLHRTHGDEFRELAEFMNEKYQISGRLLIQIIVNCRQAFSISSDPLIPQYIRAGITSGLSKTSDVLYVLIQNWNSVSPERGLSAESKQPGCLSSPDAIIINDLALIVASNATSHNSSEIRRSLSFTSRWLLALIEWISGDGENRSYLAILTLLEALGILFASIASTEQGILLLGSQDDPDLKQLVVEALDTVLPLLTSISIQLHSRLDMIQKHFHLFRTGFPKEVTQPMQNVQQTPETLQFEANIVDDSNVHARASLYIYLNGALCGRPMLDDSSLISYLNVRFAGDHVSMFIDIIVAAFDVLSNGQARSEGEQAINLYRSFLANRLPPILCLISTSSLEPVPVNLCISQALGRIDLGAFPLSAYDMGGRSSLAGVRQEFLFACALHRLIPEAGVEDLLGEKPMQSLPSHGLYEKDQLVQQISANAQRAEQLIKEIELMEGNAGAIVAAIIEVMHSHCRNRDTVPLKDLCNLIVRKPPVIDVMALFRSPGYILSPLCSLLDNWNWDELHGESQPVYEEFGAILLLVLTAASRYELTCSEIGATSISSFIRQLFQLEANEQSLDDLDEPKRKHLGNWIAALFVADSLSDELTSSCSPHDFYKLVPTLLHQSLEACASGKLNIETLKSGFDYLLEPFLLPSLVVSLQWLATHLWQTTSGTKITLPLVSSLIKRPSSSEAREIHQTVLSMVADPLYLQLQAIADNDPQKRVALAIAEALNPYLRHNWRVNWKSEDLQPLTASPGGLLISICQMFHQLLDWSTSLEVNANPPKFTFKVVSAALHLHGAPKVLLVYLKETKSLVGTEKLEAGLDMLTSIICAPFADTYASTHCLSFRDALKIQHANLVKTLKAGDTLFAEVVVRLHRKVEAFSAAAPQQEMAIDASNAIDQEISNIDLQNINLEAAAENAEIDVGALGVQPTSDDIDQILEGAAGMDNFGANTMGSGTDDMFGLEGGDMQVMNFDDMDLEGMF
ncbi:hypothetical protein GJ744_002975 [Endocarpon pusillum]|uniref:Mediator of RNA polymerase II transcription subunit 5 n=1 Tax=Endocarpon pusillum TaxID=364733 RepID=A0A8H7E037_9EURO|nr:hypothetical protein GJ744_002975 [Endocarpon pusillum]